MNSTSTPVTELLNQLLGGYWTGVVQHQTHVALLDSWGLMALARSMEARIADEPVTISSVLDRLLDLGGRPNFTVGAPVIGWPPGLGSG